MDQFFQFIIIDFLEMPQPVKKRKNQKDLIVDLRQELARVKNENEDLKVENKNLKNENKIFYQYILALSKSLNDYVAHSKLNFVYI